MEQLHYHGGDLLTAPLPGSAELLGALAVASVPNDMPAAELPASRATGRPRVSLRRLTDCEPTATEQPTQPRTASLPAHQLALALPLPGEHYWSEDEDRVSPADYHATGMLLRAIVEVMNGRRPLAQLQDRLNEQVVVSLQRHAGRFANRAHPLQLRSVHARQPAGGVIEANATVQRAERFRALAARLKTAESDTRWLCVSMHVV